MPQSPDRINFPKIIAVLAIIFGISLGLCGVTAIFAIGGRGGDAFMSFGFISLAGMILSLAALILVLPIWAIVAAVRRSRDASEEAQPSAGGSNQDQ